MRRASLISVLVGAFFLTMAFAAPTILRWQTEYTLGKYGASEYVDLAVSMNLERLASDLLVTKALSATLLISGVLMLRRLKLGLLLGVGIYMAFICTALYGFVVQEWALVPLFKSLVFAYTLYYLLAAHRRYGTIWWRQSK